MFYQIAAVVSLCCRLRLFGERRSILPGNVEKGATYMQTEVRDGRRLEQEVSYPRITKEGRNK